MLKTKKAISLILAVAMIFTAMLGCMTITSSATEGQAGGEGPKLVDYSIEIANDTKTEEGAEFKINLEFDQPVKVVENWILSAFDITLSGGNSLSAMGFELKSGTVAEDGKTVVLDIKGKGNMPRLVSGEVEVSLKSNYYDAITDQTGELPVSEWVDVNTYVPTGLSFERVSSDPGSENTAASVTFKMNGPALLRGMSSAQILVNGQSITDDASGLVPIHTHTYIIEDENGQAAFAPVSTWVNSLVSRFSSDDYTMTQGEGENADQFTITANAAGENAYLENAEVNLFAYSEPNDDVVQKTLFAEELDAAKARAAEIENSNSVAQSCKDALDMAIATAEAVQPDDITSAVEWLKTRDALQSAVDGAQDNAITTTSATRSNGTVSLSLVGGEEWIDNILSVQIDEKALTAADDYTIESGKLVVNSTCFDTTGEITPREQTYTITITSEGYDTVTQDVTIKYYGVNTFYLRLLDGKGEVIAEKTYTINDLKSHEDVVTNQYYDTACSMTGLRTFRGDGVYLSDLIEDLKAENPEVTINTDTTMIKLRTNDQVDQNDDPGEVAYYNRGQTTYNNLMQDRYWFPALFDENSSLAQTVLDNKANGINDVVRKALGESVTDADKVEPMLAFDYIETVFTSDQAKPEGKYDENLSADKRLRFLFGTKMEYDEDGNIVSAAKETTTWMASYQVYGIDLVDASQNGPKVTFESNVDDYDITVITGNGNGYPLTPNADGTYSLIAKDPYTYVATKDGYKTIEGEIDALTEDTTINLNFKAESSGGSGGGGGGSTVTNYTVAFDSNGGSSVAKQTVASGKTVSEPADPTREGYVFDGWYIDKELTDAYDFGDKVTKSFTLYAKWTEEGTEPDPGEEPGEETGTDPGTGDTPDFSDVPANSWYAEYVTYLAERGIVNGKTATTFEPDSRITRAEFIKIIAEVAGADVTGQTSSKFSDVASGSWYAPYVAWGVENGLINGVSDTQFDPNGNITRQDMATLISRYAGFAEFELPQTEEPAAFSDASDIASYAQDAVSQMQRAGIINGRGDNTFAPQDNATRAEACKMLTILMQQMGR